MVEFHIMSMMTSTFLNLLCECHPWQCWGEESQVVSEKDGGYDLKDIGPFCWPSCDELL